MPNKQGRSFPALSTLLLAPVVATSAQTASAEQPHMVVFQVSDADPAKWNLALNKPRGVQQDLGGERVATEIVAPSLSWLAAR